MALWVLAPNSRCQTAGSGQRRGFVYDSVGRQPGMWRCQQKTFTVIGVADCYDALDTWGAWRTRALPSSFCGAHRRRVRGGLGSAVTPCSHKFIMTFYRPSA
jgi:hypothetical protein